MLKFRYGVSCHLDLPKQDLRRRPLLAGSCLPNRTGVSLRSTAPAAQALRDWRVM